MCVILFDCYMIEPREIKTKRYHNEVDVDWKIPKEKLKYEKYHNGSNGAPLVYGNHFCHNLSHFIDLVASFGNPGSIGNRRSCM